MLKLLIVENNPTITRLLTHFFKEEGCEIRTAADGLQAMLVLEEFKPDILFTDIIMPKISGDQLCQIIRTRPELKDIFITVYSSVAIEDQEHIFNLHADLYLAKGPTILIQTHVRHVIEQFRSGKRQEHVLHGVEGLSSRNITKELLLTKRHHHTIFENLVEAVIEMDGNGLIIQANQAAQDLLGRGMAELAATNLTEYLALAGPAYLQIEKWFADIAATKKKKTSNQIMAAPC